MRLAGWLVGYARDDLGDAAQGDGFTNILVRSLHPRSHLTRRFNAEPDEVLAACQEECDTRSVVTDLIVRGKGAIAWIVCPDQFVAARKRRCIEGEPASVYKADSTSKRRVRLDHTSGVDIFSLRLTGSTLSWTRDGMKYRATLR